MASKWRFTLPPSAERKTNDLIVSDTSAFTQQTTKLCNCFSWNGNAIVDGEKKRFASRSRVHRLLIPKRKKFIDRFLYSLCAPSLQCTKSECTFFQTHNCNIIFLFPFRPLRPLRFPFLCFCHRVASTHLLSIRFY